MNIDISSIVENKIKQLEEDKVIEKQIEQSVETTVIKAVKDAFDDYSLKKDIKKQITDQVSKITADIGFEAYNTFIADTIKNAVIDNAKDDIKNKIAQSFETIFCKKKESIKLSEIFKEYKKQLSDIDYCDIDRANEGYTFSKLDIDDDDPFKHITIVLALENQTKSYGRTYDGDSDYKLVVNLISYKSEYYTITKITWKDKDIATKDSLFNMSDFEAFLASLYFNKTKIEIDIDEDDMQVSLVDY